MKNPNHKKIISYKFVKLYDTRTGLKYPWMLMCNDVKTLMEHEKKCMGRVIGDGVRDFLHNIETHPTTKWRSAVERLGKSRGGIDFVIQSSELENKALQGKGNALFDTGCLYLHEQGTYFTPCSTHKITDELIVDKLVYPNYTKEDIKISKWTGGSHFYATIGKTNVIDSHGNQKWNTHKRAYEVALDELKQQQ